MRLSPAPGQSESKRMRSSVAKHQLIIWLRALEKVLDLKKRLLTCSGGIVSLLARQSQVAFLRESLSHSLSTLENPCGLSSRRRPWLADVLSVRSTRVGAPGL
jgi:hypothetical protein